MDDVFSEGVVLGLDGFVVLLQDMVFAHLFLELLDVSFLAHAERSLRGTVLGGPVKESTLAWMGIELNHKYQVT